MPTVVRRKAPDLAETLREAERVVDLQVDSLKELDDKVEQMMTVALATLLGAFGFGAFLARHSDGWAPYALGLAAGALWNARALLHFARAYGVLDVELQVQVGPATHWLYDCAADGLDADEQRLLALGALHNAFVDNDRIAVFVSEHRRKGMRWLLAAVAAYAFVVLTFLSVEMLETMSNQTGIP